MIRIGIPIKKEWIWRIAGCLVTALIGAAIFEGWACARFGSAAMCLRYLRGERMVLRSPVIDLGVVKSNVKQAVSFEIVNLTDHSVQILGAKADCPCVASDGLPVTIPAGNTEALRVQVHLVRCKSNFSYKVVYYTDLDDQPAVIGRLVGSCISSVPETVHLSNSINN